MKTVYPETEPALHNHPAPSLDDTAPDVSIFLPVFNEQPNLRPLQARLDEALQKLGRPAEIIYVDDGSSDGSLNVLRELAAKDPRVRVIDTQNGGLSAARNVGLAEATGAIVAYTDADVRVDRDWLTFLVQPFLTSDVVCSGGPNVVPPDDPPMAQCIARAPGGPGQSREEESVRGRARISSRQSNERTHGGSVQRRSQAAARGGRRLHRCIDPTPVARG